MKLPFVGNRYLDPQDRSSEVLFGLIMVLTFTGSISAAEAGKTEIRLMLVGALGCNFAWGIIDGILYLIGCWAEGGRMLVAWKGVRSARTPADAHRIISDAMPQKIASVLDEAVFEKIRLELTDGPAPPSRPPIGRSELLGALAVFAWVFAVTFPVALPFLIVTDPMHALRVSNAIAVTMLYFAGASVGRHAGFAPWRIGLSMVGIGIVLVGLTIALGG